jgi:gag-polyprotein putative aspartyl protease
MTIKIPYTSIRRKAEICALVDSGATENFMDERTVQELGLGRKPLTRPGKVRNVDGTENKAGMLTHYCELRVRVGTKEGVQRFFITNLGQERTILGYPWVEYFDPPFDWKNKKLKGDVKVEFEAKYYKWIQTRAIKNFI